MTDLESIFQDQPGLTLAQKRGGLIRRGSRNARAVKALQERLSQLGYAVENDGLFGDETEKALRDFQYAKGLRTDGVLGKHSLNKLLKAKPKDGNDADISMNAVTRVVPVGDSESARRTKDLGRVRAEQRGGGAASTRGATKKKAAKAPPKGPHGGTVDPATGKEIATSTTGPIGSTDPNAPAGFKGMNGGKPVPGQEQGPANGEFEDQHPRGPGGKFAAKGSSGPQVSSTQKALNETNEAGLKVDGQFGDETDDAVRAFQKKRGIRVDGIVGPVTSQALRRRLRLIQEHGKPGSAPKIRTLDRQ